MGRDKGERGGEPSLSLSLSLSPSHFPSPHSASFLSSLFFPTVSVCLPEEVQTILVSLWENQKYTDITFLISGHPVPAHKAILASQSEYFERLLFGELREASMDEIPLQDVPLEAFQNVLQYAYSGALHTKESTLQVSSVLLPCKNAVSVRELYDVSVYVGFFSLPLSLSLSGYSGGGGSC